MKREYDFLNLKIDFFLNKGFFFLLESLFYTVFI